MEEELRINIFNLKFINQVRSQPVACIQDNMAIHDFGIAMVNVSIGLAQDIMMERLIGNIRVSMNKKGYATITNDRHYLVTPELL